MRGDQYKERILIKIPSNAKVGELKKQFMDSRIGRRHRLQDRPVGLYSFLLETEDVVDEVLSEKGKGVLLCEEQTISAAFIHLRLVKHAYVVVEDMSSDSQ